MPMMLVCRRIIIVSIVTLVIGALAVSCKKQVSTGKQVAAAPVSALTPPAGSTAAMIYNGSTFSKFDGVIPALWPSQIHIPSGGYVKQGKITSGQINPMSVSVVRSSLSLTGVVDTKPDVLITDFRDSLDAEESFRKTTDSATDNVYELEYLTKHSSSYLMIYVKVHRDQFWPKKGCYMIWIRELEDTTPNGLQNIKDLGFDVPSEETT